MRERRKNFLSLSLSEAQRRKRGLTRVERVCRTREDSYRFIHRSLARSLARTWNNDSRISAGVTTDHKRARLLSMIHAAG